MLTDNGEEAVYPLALLPVSDQDMRTLLERLVKIESPSGDVEGITQVLETVAQELDGLGVLSMESTPSGPWLKVSRGQGGALILGHADTVWPRGTLQEMPWRDEGEWVFGPGSLDMKGGLVLAVAALKSLPESVPFCLLVTPDEEVGSAVSRTVIEEQAVKARVALVLESGMPGGAIKIGRAGVGDFTLNISGIQSHAGLEPERGASAIRELAHHVLWLDGLENKALGTTVNVGLVNGGTRRNVVPGQVQADIDVRVTTRPEMERIMNTLNTPPRFDSRCQIEYSGEFNRPPMEPTSESLGWVSQAAAIWETLTGEPLVGMRVGGASDGNFTASVVPTLDGLGPVGRGAHARHESVEWRFMAPRGELIRELILRAGRRR